MALGLSDKAKQSKAVKKGEGWSLYAHQMCSTEILTTKNGVIDIFHKTSVACSA